MSGYPIVPAHPPLPTACNLPFQPEAGSQTSILMSESLVGFRVAATRQNAGNALNVWAAVGPPRPGAAKAPDPTTWASVMVVFGSVNDATPSHDAPTARV